MREAGLVPPAPIEVQLLVDTGATITWIDEMHMRSLVLEPRSWGEVHTVEGRGVSSEFSQYEVSLVFGGQATQRTRRFEPLIGGNSFINQPFDGLLGRDVLDQFQKIVWDGPKQEVTFDYV